MQNSSQAPEPTSGRNARGARTRATLRSALMRLLERKSLEQVKIREIVAEAGIGYATFFRHYSDKESLLDDLAARQINSLICLTLPVLYRGEGRSGSRTLCTYVWEHRKIWSVLLTGGAAGSVKQEFIRQAREVSAKQDNPKSWPPGDLMAAFSGAGALEILTWWLERGQGFSVSDVAEIIDHLIIAPSFPTA